MLIDTHTHLYLEEFPDGGSEAVKRAIEAGVGHMIFPNVSVSTIEPMQALHRSFPEVTSMAMGLHPTEVEADFASQLDLVESHLADAAGYVAVGEIGMDLYWEQKFRSEQMEALNRQLDWAEKLSLPVIIHCREALAPTLEVLESHRGVRGVFHSFGGSESDVEEIRRRIGDHFYFGINGILTFKNSSLKSVLPAITPDRILLETDSPYLAPVPHRGKRNESAYMIHTAAVAADALGLTKEALAAVTTANASELFKLSLA